MSSLALSMALSSLVSAKGSRVLKEVPGGPACSQPVQLLKFSRRGFGRAFPCLHTASQAPLLKKCTDIEGHISAQTEGRTVKYLCRGLARFADVDQVEYVSFSPQMLNRVFHSCIGTLRELDREHEVSLLLLPHFCDCALMLRLRSVEAC